jgi:hypothetical protein
MLGTALFMDTLFKKKNKGIQKIITVLESTIYDMNEFSLLDKALIAEDVLIINKLNDQIEDLQNEVIILKEEIEVFKLDNNKLKLTIDVFQSSLAKKDNTINLYAGIVSMKNDGIVGLHEINQELRAEMLTLQTKISFLEAHNSYQD